MESRKDGRDLLPAKPADMEVGSCEGTASDLKLVDIDSDDRKDGIFSLAG